MPSHAYPRNSRTLEVGPCVFAAYCIGTLSEMSFPFEVAWLLYKNALGVTVLRGISGKWCLER